MFLAVAALVLQFPLFSAKIQAPAKVDPPVAGSQTRLIPPTQSRRRSVSPDKQVLIADFDSRRESRFRRYAPGRLVPEPAAPAAAIIATPAPGPVALISAEPVPIVPVYSPMRGGLRTVAPPRVDGLEHRRPWHRRIRCLVDPSRAFLHAGRSRNESIVAALCRERLDVCRGSNGSDGSRFREPPNDE